MRSRAASRLRPQKQPNKAFPEGCPAVLYFFIQIDMGVTRESATIQECFVCLTRFTHLLPERWKTILDALSSVVVMPVFPASFGARLSLVGAYRVLYYFDHLFTACHPSPQKFTGIGLKNPTDRVTDRQKFIRPNHPADPCYPLRPHQAQWGRRTPDMR
jgi:hypothetical protein